MAYAQNMGNEVDLGSNAGIPVMSSMLRTELSTEAGETPRVGVTTPFLKRDERLRP